MIEFNIQEIEKKQKRLEQAKTNLKNYFVGLDDIIDNIFRNISIWYLMPDLLMRPITINLWGMTGVGKTDLVRRLSSELEFNNKFIEIPLSNSEKGYFSNSIKDVFDTTEITQDEQAIILLDEIQRFRTVDEDGHMTDANNYQDIWMLLSDGKFENDTKEYNDLIEMYLDLIYEKNNCDDDDDDDGIVEPKPQKRTKKEREIARCLKNNVLTDDPKNILIAGRKTKKTKNGNKKQRKFTMQIWQAKRLKRKLGLSDNAEEIMTWAYEKKLSVIKNKIEEFSINGKSLNIDNKKYKKLLIFICGNLDKAYEMSRNVAEVDVDADILHKFSKKIDIIKIKECLLKSFKPEQIARFGNTHIIYPSLSKANYYEIIDKQLERLSQEIYKNLFIKVEYDQTIKDCLYKNGVFPTQGVRPLFSTISSIIENSVPEFLFYCVKNNLEKNIYLKADVRNSEIHCAVENETIKRKVQFQIDEIRTDINKEMFCNVCVHEAGHAVVYALLFNTAPAQVCGNSIAQNAEGFMFPHLYSNSKKQCIEQAQAGLAGTVAEEIVFGEYFKTTGNLNDIKQATTIISRIVRSSNMAGFVGNIVSEASDMTDPNNCLTNIEQTNAVIEKILTEQKNKTKELLQKNGLFFKDVIKELTKKKTLSSKEFYDIAKKYTKDIKIIDHNKTITENYEEKLNCFLNS